MTVKRPLDDDTEIESMAMANCLMLLSKVGEPGSTGSPGRLFHCKTCNKAFQSFQALGGHRASHKRPKLAELISQSAPMKPKTHECAICGQEFALGQALGGHMRRHRDELNGKTADVAVIKKQQQSVDQTRGLCLDLNLMPYENDLRLWPIVS